VVPPAMSAADHLIMAAVICISVAVMIALVFRADHQAGSGRPRSGRQRHDHRHRALQEGREPGANPDGAGGARATPASHQPLDRDSESASGGHPGQRRETPASDDMTIRPQ